MRRPLAGLAGLALVAGFALAACGGSEEDTDASARTSAVNEADIAFAQGMIPHHEQAVEMAQLAEGRVDDPEVADLAEAIEAAQEPEIETMRGWLEAWGEGDGGDGGDGSDGMDHEDMDHGAMGGDDAMMDAEQMADLEGASGADWDRMFLTMMIDHHEGAVDMARTEVAEGENPDAVALAEKVIEDQSAEIEQMQTLLEDAG